MPISVNADVSINTPEYDVNGNPIGIIVTVALGYVDRRLQATSVTVSDR